jgi:SET domain-containing protein
MKRINLLQPTCDWWIKDELWKVLDSGWWQNGPKVKEFEEKFADAGLGTYVLTLDDPSEEGRNFYVDGLKKGNWTSRINSPKGTLNKVNIVFYTDGRVVAKRNIKAGDELFVGYGPKYWNNRYWKNNSNTTRKNKN